MLSKTEIRNGQKVQEVICEVALVKEGVWNRWFTIGEIARASGMSRKTVTKYVELLIGIDAVEEQKRDMRYCTKNTTRLFKWVSQYDPFYVEGGE